MPRATQLYKEIYRFVETGGSLFYVHGTVRLNSVSINIQQDATIHTLFYL